MRARWCLVVVYSHVPTGDTGAISTSHRPGPEAAMDFPIIDLMDEQACYDRLVGWLHPDGFACSHCHAADRMAFDNRDRMPLDDRAVEADEAYRNAGKKRHPAPRPGGPAAAAGHQSARARHLGGRPPAGLRG